jgi:lipopolysaccharide transport system ATP-binding protein
LHGWDLLGFKRHEKGLPMCFEYAIKVENLSKCYQIYDAPRDRLKQFVLPRLKRVLGRKPTNYFREFWALRDVSFEVNRGETVGIIGRNGSGKSTLLQMICGTLTPTSGSIQTHGRIAALLELGSGFNPEFTGRENVYMNASLLGLTKEEIDVHYEDIVAFADIGDFIKQPVKTYSSGMYLRLAFAVIVHVNADILIVDEALAVGDAFFVQKCITQIRKLMDSGITLLFVSHDSNAVKSLCDRAILLEDGELSCMGNTDKVVETYYGKIIQKRQDNILPLNSKNNSSKQGFKDGLSLIDNEVFQQRAKFQRLQNGKVNFVNVQLLNGDGQEIQRVHFGQCVVLRAIFCARYHIPLVHMAYHIRDKNGFDIVYSDTAIEDCPITNLSVGSMYFVDWQFRVYLIEGDYTFATMLSIPIDLNTGQTEVCDFVPIAFQMKVTRGNSLPIYGAVYWGNKVTCHFINDGALGSNDKCFKRQ